MLRKIKSNLVMFFLFEIKENRICIRVEFTRKKCKTAIFSYCFHTLQVYFTYLRYSTFWALEHHFVENLKLILKENQIMKKAGCIIDKWSFHISFMPFTLKTMIFRFNYKSNDVFYSHEFYKVYLTALKNSKNEMDSLGNILY